MPFSMTQKSPIKIAIYDMDKTVTRRATYNGFLLYMAWNRAPLRLFLTPVLLFALVLFTCKFWDRKRLKEFSQRLLIGSAVSHDSLKPYLEQHADWVLRKNIYAQARNRIAEEKAAGYVHILATASYRLYVDAIAARLGFETVIATELLQDGKARILAQIDGQNCYDAEKLERVETWMVAQGIVRSDCYIRAYSDHVSDAPLLGFADEAFATNPHQPLQVLAQNQNWSILDWRN